MKTQTKSYNKSTFFKFLQENNLNSEIIKKFNDLPEKIKKNNTSYLLNIILTWSNDGNTQYNFELNYYSEEKMEFLFNYKIFTNIETSIDYLVVMLKKQ